MTEPALSAEVVPVRRRVYFSGRVQGVGFRFTTNAIASRFPVTGYVRNLADGRVELVAEATLEVLNRFQSAVGKAMGDKIRAADVDESPATGEFDSFSITR